MYRLGPGLGETEEGMPQSQSPCPCPRVNQQISHKICEQKLLSYMNLSNVTATLSYQLPHLSQVSLVASPNSKLYRGENSGKQSSSLAKLTQYQATTLSFQYSFLLFFCPSCSQISIFSPSSVKETEVPMHSTQSNNFLVEGDGSNGI